MRNRYTILLLFRCALASPLFASLKSPLVAAMTTAKKTHTHPELWSPEFWEKIVISGVLVLMGGVFAGLTLGLMGLDELHLRVLAASSAEETEQKNAKKVLQLMAKGRHWVLVVLLLGNVIINESLPIFLDSAIGGGFAAVALSTTAIGEFPCSHLWFLCRAASIHPFYLSIFSTYLPSISFFPRRIIPQAVSVRYGLSIGAACAPFVLGLMYLFAPVAWPIAKLLDAVLGTNETHTYKKAELKSFLQFHRTGEEPLRDDEISILNGVLELNNKRVDGDGVMTKMEDVLSLSLDARLDDKLVETILLSGYSRFPVHEPNDPKAFVGLLLIKKLLKYDPALALPVSSFPLSILPEAPPEHQLFPGVGLFVRFVFFLVFTRSSFLPRFYVSVLIAWRLSATSGACVMRFPQTGRAHLLLISRTPGKPGGAIGVVTLEDIIEEILSEEIVDETDRYEDNVSKAKAKRVTTAAVMRGCVLELTVDHPMLVCLLLSLCIVERTQRAQSISRSSAGDRTPVAPRSPLLPSNASITSADGERTPLVSADGDADRRSLRSIGKGGYGSTGQ
ncbi:hypothetical protein MVEN_01953800 [Mycena venus]|uniref:CNNM transmembrane domain-containing protein n=1 Tax=Mycena venus TaxID=2733690 RepID=A0A8H7CLC5_9AGAR|nr:hypothetical protein MVEN_01953800 [Mycena venus]